MLQQHELCVVTSSLDPERTMHLWDSWKREDPHISPIMVIPGHHTVRVPSQLDFFHIIRTESILAVVPAFYLGLTYAKALGYKWVACLHDDVRMDEPQWGQKLLNFLKAHPTSLVGFGGGRSLGAEDIYRTPYHPSQLARGDFISNMQEAEAHGRRVTEPTRVACLDGFSQCGPLELLWKWYEHLFDAGFRHHAYDAALGCLAHTNPRGGGAWMLPLKCHHHGGLTGAGYGPYQEWAKSQHPNGDAGFWEEAHRITYENFRHVLPIRARE